MSTDLLAILVLVPTAAVVLAIGCVIWRERTTSRETVVAAVSIGVIAAWAIGATVMARRGMFLQPDGRSIPPIGVALVAAFVGLAAALISSRSLRRLLTNQPNLIRLNLWRLVGAVFLLLMANGQMPALWALPAGIGDIIVGATAPLVAIQLDSPGGRRRAILFNLFGMADLVVAVGMGMLTSTGPTQVFVTTPTSELATHFPLVLVPSFLVPLAFTLHVISLSQLVNGSWARSASAA